MTSTELTGKVTNLELAQWLAQGNGQVRIPLYSDVPIFGGTSIVADTHYVYIGKDTDYPEKEYDYPVQVRKWGDSDWHEPTRDYMYMDMPLNENVSTETQKRNNL